MGPPSGSALKPNVELELPESDLREEMEDSGKNLFYTTGCLILKWTKLNDSEARGTHYISLILLNYVA